MPLRLRNSEQYEELEEGPLISCIAVIQEHILSLEHELREFQCHSQNTMKLMQQNLRSLREQLRDHMSHLMSHELQKNLDASPHATTISYVEQYLHENTQSPFREVLMKLDKLPPRHNQIFVSAETVSEFERVILQSYSAYKDRYDREGYHSDYSIRSYMSSKSRQHLLIAMLLLEHESQCLTSANLEILSGYKQSGIACALPKVFSIFEDLPNHYSIIGDAKNGITLQRISSSESRSS